jgi:hypothetical protein
MKIIKLLSFIEESFAEAGRDADRPLRKVVVAGIVENPYAGQPFQQDLSALIEGSRSVGHAITRRGVELMGTEKVESYGKGAIVGLAGEQEHGVAMLTTIFGDIMRDAVGGGAAWVSSATKIGGPGTSIDIPLAYKDALYVRSHYDAMSVTLHSAPLPSQIAVICGFANRGRLNQRVGGVKKEEAKGLDGLR